MLQPLKTCFKDSIKDLKHCVKFFRRGDLTKGYRCLLDFIALMGLVSLTIMQCSTYNAERNSKAKLRLAKCLDTTNSIIHGMSVALKEGQYPDVADIIEDELILAIIDMDEAINGALIAEWSEYANSITSEA